MDDISNFVHNEINTPYWLVRKVSNYINVGAQKMDILRKNVSKNVRIMGVSSIITRPHTQSWIKISKDICPLGSVLVYYSFIILFNKAINAFIKKFKI